jgi:hypothetical protein
MTAPGTYRKKPVQIQAIHWDGTAEGATPVIDWVLAGGGTARYSDATDAPGARTEIAIDTLEGTITAAPGDYVIRGVQGEHYPCKPDIFAATYDEVPE